MIDQELILAQQERLRVAKANEHILAAKVDVLNATLQDLTRQYRAATDEVKAARAAIEEATDPA